MGKITQGPWARLLFVLQAHPFLHQVLDIPIGVPLVVLVKDDSSFRIVARLDLQFVVLGQVAFALNVREEMRDVAEFGLFSAADALQRDGSHLAGLVKA